MVELVVLALFLLVLGVGGLIADYIFPHIEFLNDFIDNLPIMAKRKERDIYLSQEDETA